MLDIGWSELLLVAIVALIVVGPKDLPRLMRTIGRFTGKARRMAREFRTGFEELGRETDLEEINKEMEKIRREDPFSNRSNAIVPPRNSESPTLAVRHEPKKEQASTASQESTQSNTSG